MGHAVDEMKPALQRLFDRYDREITHPELQWAQLVADGTRIEFKPDEIRW